MWYMVYPILTKILRITNGMFIHSYKCNCIKNSAHPGRRRRRPQPCCAGEGTKEGLGGREERGPPLVEESWRHLGPGGGEAPVSGSEREAFGPFWKPRGCCSAPAAFLIGSSRLHSPQSPPGAWGLVTLASFFRPRHGSWAERGRLVDGWLISYCLDCQRLLVVTCSNTYTVSILKECFID